MILHESNTAFIKNEYFKTIIQNTPLVSVDLIVKHNNKILLGKRVNKPARSYWFTLGGRVLKNEKMQDAIKRITKEELGTVSDTIPKFIGIYEHMYDDSIFENISTHYVNIAYEINILNFDNLPKKQHDAYQWFDLEDLMQDKYVHDYVKDYFSIEQGTVPHTKQELKCQKRKLL